MGIPHLAFDLRLRSQGCDRVDNDDVYGVGAHQHVADLQSLFAGIRLGDQQIVDIDPQLGGIDGIQGVLGIDEGAGLAFALSLGNHLQGQRGLARGFRAVDFHHPAAGQTANAERHVQREGAGRDGFDVHGLAVAQTHDGAFTKLFLNLTQRCRQCLLLVLIHANLRWKS